MLGVQGNLPTLRRDGAPATAGPARQRGHAHTVRLAHGQIEERTLMVASARDIVWPHAREMLRIRHRFVPQRTGRVIRDAAVQAVTLLLPERARPADLPALWPAHWPSAHRLHGLGEVVRGEDAASAHTANAPQALAAFRNLAVSQPQLWRGSAMTVARAVYAPHSTARFRHCARAPR